MQNGNAFVVFLLRDSLLSGGFLHGLLGGFDFLCRGGRGGFRGVDRRARHRGIARNGRSLDGLGGILFLDFDLEEVVCEDRIEQQEQSERDKGPYEMAEFIR